ncbi:MAG: LysR family transcriptional regulator [Clostridiales bacterium]|jgi:DNA-binding transcriptional LysR family regulator|nr:LysR family transcriptional regulator [Clostridiales bacterium]
MYNPKLEMFVKVAEAGSFSKAAEDNYITPTAVIKQINSLEEALGLHLFIRTHRGLTLTASGQSLFNDAKYIMNYCKESVQRAKRAQGGKTRILRVGTSPMTPGEFLLSLPIGLRDIVPEVKVELVPFQNTPENAREILANLGRNIDVVAGLFDETFEKERGCAALKLEDAPICCAVGLHHPLAAKNRISIDDLRGEKLMLIRRGWNLYVDKLRDFAVREQLAISDFNFFDLSVFNHCEHSNDVLIAFGFWKHAHPLMKILPVDWEFTVPYGLLYAPKPSETVALFLEALSRKREL